MTATTTEAPTAQSNPTTCPRWCDSPHEIGEAHQSSAFCVEGVGKAHLLSIVQEESAEPRIVLETETLGDAPVLVDTFDPDQAQSLFTHIGDLLCLIQACGCRGDIACPGSPDYREEW